MDKYFIGVIVGLIISFINQFVFATIGPGFFAFVILWAIGGFIFGLGYFAVRDRP